MSVDRTTRPPAGVLMTHTTRTIHPLSIEPSITHTELSRIFPNGIPRNLDISRPIIAQACSNPMALSTWLNAQLPDQQQQIPSPPSESFVITIEEDVTPTTNSSQSSSYDNQNNHQHTTTTDNFLNNIREASHSTNNNNDNNNNNNNNNEDNLEERLLDLLPISHQTREDFKSTQIYIPFAAVTIAKGIYDHRSGAFSLILLLAVFIKANRDLKEEISKQQRRSRKALLNILCYIFGAFAIISLGLNEYPIFFCAKSDSLWDLLWSIAVTDFVFKLITVSFKALLTCLPANILAFEKRGKYYLWMEATSQFYRAIIPIFSWMYYFIETCEGAEYIPVILLALLYGATKVHEIMCRGKLLMNSIVKFWYNVSLGSSPSKEQLAKSGNICVICHEYYSTPVQLHCKHIFCESCVTIWLGRERTCPLCRATITDDFVYRDGHTSHNVQLC